ncbi:shikimate kinase [Stratiformator vulcanicus]|uniref:Shikimate kinase n=1 Tax=Stratiformator vulcanicus TaxID=2527980 RepID=A0A517R2J5_9PLAN|nr:shikimate kinase [Stratiformator vulcanicus]QDT38105.1 Shikimate kinase [Stratiformator vulcanicus]
MNETPGVITLIGYRGSGKSSIAPLLATRLGWTSVDADAEIERRAERSISQIFELEGESTFRELERQVMRDLLKSSAIIVAAGGGAAINDETRAEMKAAGEVVYLSATVDVLAGRIAGDESSPDRRPNLTGTGGRVEIVRMLSLREPIYRQAASLTVDVDELSPDQIADRIEMFLRKRRAVWFNA